MTEIHHESQGTALCYAVVTYLWFSPGSLATENGNGMEASLDGVYSLNAFILNALQGCCTQPYNSVPPFSASYPFTFLRSRRTVDFLYRPCTAQRRNTHMLCAFMGILLLYFIVVVSFILESKYFWTTGRQMPFIYERKNTVGTAGVS